MAPNFKNGFKNTLIKAYFYIIHADGKVDDKEVLLGRKIVEKEKIEDQEFKEKMDSLATQQPDKVYASLKDDLKKLSRKEQIKIIAYMSNVANADGFMDSSEWRIIFKLYKELNLNLEDILAVQKQIPPFS